MWVLSRICEEFQCLPSMAIREWENDPHDWVRHIMNCRAYARAKASWDAAQGEHQQAHRDQLMSNAMVMDVIEHEFELIQEKRARR